MVEKFFAATVLAACAVFMVRLLVGERRRLRFDMAARQAWHGLKRRSVALYRWRSSRRDAEREAQEAIQRAREGGRWEGNVYKTRAFRRPRKPH